MSVIGMILAGGVGSRLKTMGSDKALFELRGVPCFYYSVKVFQESGLFDKVMIVYRDSIQRQQMEVYLANNAVDVDIVWVQGGLRRQDSVYAGLKILELLKPAVEYVFIHDGVRPLIKVEGLKMLYEAVTNYKAAALMNTIVDTIKAVDVGSQEGNGLARLVDVERNQLRVMQTPQAFDFRLIKEAHDYVFDSHLEITDDVSAAVVRGHKIGLVNNPFANPKLTYVGDIAYLEFLLSEKAVVCE